MQYPSIDNFGPTAYNKRYSDCGDFGEGGTWKMRAKFGFLKRVLVLVCVLMMVAGSALASFDAYVFPGTMKIYDTPNHQIGVLPMGTRVTVEAVSGNWSLINWNGHRGFARSEDMMAVNSIRSTTNRETTIYYITPDNFTPRTGTLPRGVDVYVRGFRDGMTLVSNADFTVLGYISSSNVG